MGRFKEKFIPVQINQELCLRCERCLGACKEKAIFFKHSIRLVDYSKCKACLNCVQVCPRNAIQVTSIESNDQIISIKVDHEKCSMCNLCLNDSGAFCPKNLFYQDDIENKENQETKGIRFKFKEISKCQGCLKCVALCPENAIKPIKFKV
ncbi:MAG: 4Fe-4S binding protein [Promethearchaeota archaeon]